jgi:hypothetical protein
MDRDWPPRGHPQQPPPNMAEWIFKSILIGLAVGLIGTLLIFVFLVPNAEPPQVR